MDLSALLEKQRARFASIEPLEVEVLLGDRVVTVVMPFMSPAAFTDFAYQFAPATPQDWSLGFGLDEAARNYPDIAIRDDGETDHLLIVQDKAVHYRWPEVYDVLTWDDKGSIRAGVWGLYVMDPRQWKSAAKATVEEAADES